MMSARTRTFTWQDPTETARHLAAMRRLDVFRAMLAGEIPPPPIACLVDMDMTEAEEGREELKCKTID
ncbi:MAG: hypothetical protein ACE5FI_13840 [Anaerolineales bacterium]